ncbi:MAG: putative pre6S rRNA nuclease [Halanaerobiales bacterium]|nr:putative pre6S rRNA nuclease [Halanaerobiales bacterium]
MRVMGLDFGDKTIGVAISDALGLTAQSKGVIRRSNLNADLEELKKYISDYQVSEIIIGLPKNMNGTLGSRAEKTGQFVNFLKKRLDLPIKLWDERLSTVEAEKLLINADLSRAKRKVVIDQVAAAIILQSYLDARNRLSN